MGQGNTPNVIAAAARSRRRFNLLVIGGGLVALLTAAYYLRQAARPQPYRLRMTAGSGQGHRHQLAEMIRERAPRHGLRVELVTTPGSEAAADMIAAGQLDAALVQGGLDPRRGVTQIAALAVEPLHLLVRPELATKGPQGLRGKRLNLGPAGSGTRHLAAELLQFAGWRPGRDWRDESRSYEELAVLPDAELPDGIFTVSLLPSPVAEQLVRRRGYRLMPLPFGSAMALRDAALVNAEIPAYTYRVTPPEPPRPLPTVGARLLLIGSERLPADAVRALLETVMDGSFARAAQLPSLEEESIAQSPEFPVHPGTLAYLQRNQPVVTPELIEGIENLRSFLVSLAVALFFGWRWYLKRRQVGFERYLNEVTDAERHALELEERRPLPVDELRAIRTQVGQLKNEALAKYAAGELRGEELLASFLAHANDVRLHIHSLLAQERERPGEAPAPPAAGGAAAAADRKRPGPRARRN